MFASDLLKSSKALKLSDSTKPQNLTLIIRALRLLNLAPLLAVTFQRHSCRTSSFTTSSGGGAEIRSGSTHRPLSSSFLGLPYRILNINHKKELLRGLWVGFMGLRSWSSVVFVGGGGFVYKGIYKGSIRGSTRAGAGFMDLRYGVQGL